MRIVKIETIDIKEKIEKCDSSYIPELVEQLPDDYKPSEEIVKILDEKGYKVE